MFSAEGVFDKPGIRIISPVIGITKPAPAASLISRTVTKKSFGLPSKSGLSDKDFCVLPYKSAGAPSQTF